MASLFFERISSSSSSSYSFSTHRRKYDVFLSFRSEETRNGFSDHLFEELIRKRIHVFRDDEKLQRGEVVALERMKAIEESQYAIVVLSEKFADSKWCLNELAKIVECREKTGLSIFPVFDHVDPSDVHNQKGPFETVFAKHETDDRVTIEKKQKWMDALRDVSNISGWCLHDRSESTVIQNIVERMHSELYGEFESISKDLVGMESSIEGVIDLLDKGSDDVRFIGIWGCGGVGKTTLAQVIYCKISNQFDTKSFICFGSVGQTKNDYLVPMQKLLLSNIYTKRELNITSVHEGKKVIKQMLCSRKVLIVLDNVNNKGQLDAIAESRDWFGAGSRLIITSRDKQLLTSYNVDMYEAKTLDNDKALELFSRKAFKQPHPKKDFVDLSNDFVKYAQGLPLFLEVFGSSLHKEGIEVWKIFLDQLNENSSGKIMERLEISYKRILDQKAKELFLDIAFFFKGMDKNRVANILNDPSYWENIDILKKKSLITILGRKIWMHDLLQEMGREIVEREAPQEPGIRSRLWHHEDIFSILKNNTGTKRVEGMMLNCPPNKEDLNANCFSEMTRLRLINICNVLLPHGLNYLSNELQMMEWNDYPLKFMPRNFRPKNLVELIMHHSHIEQLPEEFTNLDQLKLMDLSYSQNLIKTPDFIGFRNLERVIFQGCTRLYHVQPSVVALRWLTLLNLKDCKHLKSLPYEIDLESLEIFILSGCSRLKKFSEIGRNMTRLSELYLDGTAIKVLPPSIKHLTGLTLLNLKDCNDLLNFPSVICSLTSLEILTLSGCRGQPRKPLHLLGLSPMASSLGVNLTFKGTILLLIMSFLVLPYNYLSIFVCATLIIWTYCFLNARYPEPEPINLLLPKSFSGLSFLKSLDLSDCNLSDGALPEDLSCLSSLRFLNLGKNNFTFLPDSISQLSKLKLLCLDNCSNLQSLPYLPSSTNFVMARGCTSLENYSKKVVVWTSGETGFTFINCLSLVKEEDKITEVSLLGSLLEDEGSKRTEVSLLDIHFQPLWQRYMEDQIRESEGFCCVLPQREITEWFKNQNCGSYVSIPLHRYNISLRGIALCVDFEVHKYSNEVSPGQDAKFICRLYIDGAPIDPIVYTVPRDKICVGSFGIWLYISHKMIREVDQCDCIRPLIRTNSADIEIKGCGARILYESDVVGFVQHLSQNIFGSPDDLHRGSEVVQHLSQNIFGSPDDLHRGSEDSIKCHLGNSQSPRWKYDVFLSFRSEDTWKSFTKHLYLALKQKDIITFINDETLERGKSISPELSKAIEESRLAIVIFSRNYAFSTLCLDELTKIIGCMKEMGMTFLPIFYDVDLSDVQKQIGTFAQAFAKHEESFEENKKKVQKWRDALREAANFSGWHLQDRSEAECIQDIVQVILNKLRNTFSAHTMGLIGIESRVEKLKSYLAIESNDVRIIGIWGTGGMGKTTLARVVYSMVSNHFEACCFIANIREESKKCGLCKLQKILLEKLLMLENLNLQDVDDGVQMIKNRLHNKKILLVLDDVNELDQLKKLAGEHCWFGSGSRIMITTRDKHLLVNPEVNEIYEAEVLNHDEALKLFSLKAFKKDHPPEDYGMLSQAFVNYSKGLPLALEVLGSFLFGKNIDEWKNGLDRLNEFPERRILDVLQISFNGLQPTEKEIFLNIACFFNHMFQDVVIQIHDDLGLYPKIGLRVLIDKSLVKLHENQLWMHDLLQELGQDIVRQECPKDPGKHSRLWLFEDIDNVLTKNTGTEAIQGIVLKLHEPKKVYWNPEAFSKMGDLKLLKICGVQLMHDLKHLPNSLRVLDWRGYPSKSLTSSSQSKSFENLKFIELSESLKLIEAPDIIEIPNLESLVLKNCINLRRIHPSIGIHKKLTILNLNSCKNLRCLPSKFEMECLTELSLYGCSKITRIPEFGRNMKRVHSLYLSGTAITTLPTSIEHLTDLIWLNLRNCKNLVHLPDTIFNLKSIEMVDLEGCSKLDRLPENLGNAESLGQLYLSETAIRKVPSSIGLLKHLKRLYFRGCKGLSSNKSKNELLLFYSMPTIPHPIDLLFSSLSLSPASSLRYLDLKDCNLKAISNDIGSLFSLELLILSGNDFVCLPESIIRLSKLEGMFLNNCTSLRSLPKLPLNIRRVKADGCISLEMLPDPLKPSDSLEPSLNLQNCFQLADNQSCVDWFISGIKKSLKLSPSLPLSLQKPEPYFPYAIVIPGSEIPEWFSHQSMGNEVKIKQPSRLCKNVGIAICVVFCTNDDPCPSPLYRDYSLIANGKRIDIKVCPLFDKVPSDHVSLAYVVPQFFDEESNKLLWEGDVNGFSQIRIQIKTIDSRMKIKKWGIRMIHKKDIEDLDRTMVQCSNSSITPYDGMDVLHHNFDNSSVEVECHKVKGSRDDTMGLNPVEKEAQK